VSLNGSLFREEPIMLDTSAVSTPAPVTDRVTTLTPRGHAALAILRLKRQLEQLDAATWSTSARCWLTCLSTPPGLPTPSV